MSVYDSLIGRLADAGPAPAWTETRSNFTWTEAISSTTCAGWRVRWAGPHEG